MLPPCLVLAGAVSIQDVNEVTDVAQLLADTAVVLSLKPLNSMLEEAQNELPLELMNGFWQSPLLETSTILQYSHNWGPRVRSGRKMRRAYTIAQASAL